MTDPHFDRTWLTPPNYVGRGLVNLMAELEQRLGGSPSNLVLDSDLSALIPRAETYALVLFDGLGAHQLDHPGAPDLASAMAATIEAPFPTMTTASLATVATGLTPAEHGLIAYLLWDQQFGTTINTIHMRAVASDGYPTVDVSLDLETFLPTPNLWERLAAIGVESVVVQPANFQQSPLTTVLYRGARFEPYTSVDEGIEVVKDVASHPHRLVFAYLPHVDVAAHVAGQRDPMYAGAIADANRFWSGLERHVPGSAALLGTADHGHFDIAEHDKHHISPPDPNVVLYGDARCLLVHGDPGSVFDGVPGQLIDGDVVASWWGATPLSDEFSGRRPDAAFIAAPEAGLFTPIINDRLVGYHGGLTPAEKDIPLLIRA